MIARQDIVWFDSVLTVVTRSFQKIAAADLLSFYIFISKQICVPVV
jgi:hypothetical protein